jgi:hypothetical protein
MKDIAIHKVQRELESICEVTFVFQHFCQHLLHSHIDEIVSGHNYFVINTHFFRKAFLKMKLLRLIFVHVYIFVVVQH